MTDALYVPSSPTILLNVLKSCNEKHKRYLFPYYQKLTLAIDYLTESYEAGGMIVDIVKSFSAVCSILPQPAAYYTLLVKNYNKILGCYFDEELPFPEERRNDFLNSLLVLTCHFCVRVNECNCLLDISKMADLIQIGLKNDDIDTQRVTLYCIQRLLGCKKVTIELVKNYKIPDYSEILSISCPYGHIYFDCEVFDSCVKNIVESFVSYCLPSKKSRFNICLSEEYIDSVLIMLSIVYNTKRNECCNIKCLMKLLQSDLLQYSQVKIYIYLLFSELITKNKDVIEKINVKEIFPYLIKDLNSNNELTRIFVY